MHIKLSATAADHILYQRKFKGLQDKNWQVATFFIYNLRLIEWNTAVNIKVSLSQPQGDVISILIKLQPAPTLASTTLNNLVTTNSSMQEIFLTHPGEARKICK